jgi:RHS repeat-associated protein
MDADFGTLRPPGMAAGGDFSVRWTGDIQIPTTGTYGFGTPIAGSNTGWAEVYIDDRGVSAGQVTSGPKGTIALTAGRHRMTVMFHTTKSGSTTQPAGVYVRYTPPGVTGLYAPTGMLVPRYNLATSSSVDDSTAGSPPGSTRTSYQNPSNLLATSQAVDPTGLDLVSGSDFGARGDGNFYRLKSSTMPSGEATTYGYYGASETVAATGCGGTTAWPQRGGLDTTTNPDGRVERQIRDDHGRQIASRTDGDAGWVCTSYDDRGRPTSVTYPDRTVTSDYAVAGDPLVTSVSDPAGTITTRVDLLGRTVSYTDAKNQTSTTTYDQAGRVTATAGPQGPVAFTYDAGGRETSQSWDGAVVAQVTYDAHFDLASVAYPTGAGNGGNGTTLTVGRDADGRTDSLTATGPGGVITSDQVASASGSGYSQSGRVVAERVDATSGAATSTFAYDTAGRLTDASVTTGSGGGSSTLHYVYGTTPGCGAGAMADPGADSNRSSVTIDGATTDYCYGPGDRLASTSGATPVGTVGYDGHGNTTTLGGDTYNWDDADRHTSTTAGATTVTYQRDATDRVVDRTAAGTTVAYSYATGGDSPVAVLDNTGAVTARMVGLPGGVTVTRQASGDTWSYPNIHGDVTATTNNTGTKVGATLRYDPFGNPLTGVADDLPGDYDYAWLGTKTRPVEHQGGLRPTIEMGARPYDPQLGRFLTVDPIPGGSANNYDYTNQNPVNGTDLTGMYMPCGATGTANCNHGHQGAIAGVARQNARLRREGIEKYVGHQGAPSLRVAAISAYTSPHAGLLSTSRTVGKAAWDMVKVGASTIRPLANLIIEAHEMAIACQTGGAAGAYVGLYTALYTGPEAPVIGGGVGCIAGAGYVVIIHRTR